MFCGLAETCSTKFTLQSDRQQFKGTCRPWRTVDSSARIQLCDVHKSHNWFPSHSSTWMASWIDPLDSTTPSGTRQFHWQHFYLQKQKLHKFLTATVLSLDNEIKKRLEEEKLWKNLIIDSYLYRLCFSHTTTARHFSQYTRDTSLNAILINKTATTTAIDDDDNQNRPES